MSEGAEAKSSPPAPDPQPPNPDFFAQALRRISIWTLGLALLGTLAAWVIQGWQGGAGFVVGAAVSWLNFYWLKRMVAALGTGGEAQPRSRAAVLFGLRYLLLGAGAYAILRFSVLSVPALLTGIFVAVGAVIVEILFELVYARN